MKKFLPVILVTVTILVYGQQSVLSTGTWFKFGVGKDGIYQISYELLAALGASPSSINPKTIKLYAAQSGMLPQPNASIRKSSLTEIPLYFSGQADGIFNRGDRIIFYGQGPDSLYYDRGNKIFYLEKNLYSDQHYYYLTFGGQNGQRISNRPEETGGVTSVSTYDDYFHSEEDKTNILKSGREWFGLDFDANTEAIINWEMKNVVAGSDVRLLSRLMAEAYENASFTLALNGATLGQLPINAIPQTTYAIKGRTRTDTLETKAINGENKFNLKITYTRSGGSYSIGRLDYITATLKRKLVYSEVPLIFFGTDAGDGLTEFSIESDGAWSVWDVTNPLKTYGKTSRYEGGQIKFKANTTKLSRYIVLNPQQQFDKPLTGVKIQNQNLEAIDQVDLIIITHPDFKSEAIRLRNHRQVHDGLACQVVTPEEIFNEYSSGKQDVSAIRDFIRAVYLRSNQKLKYVLLFGRGSYDFKNRIAENTNFVPTYESRNSLLPLETYASDDFYGFLEDQEGSWSEQPAEFHSLDIGIGRIPCTSSEKARIIVDKLISYDTDPKSAGAWQKEIAFVADDGDGNTHQFQAEQLAGKIENDHPGYHLNRIYLDLFEQEEKSFGQISRQASEALLRTFEEGSLLINYTGHGSEQLWMAERVLDSDRIDALNNRNKLPFLVTATCEFGRCDDPLIFSSAERLLLANGGGAVGLVTTSRPVNSATNFQINSDFYDALWTRTNGRLNRIGDVFRLTKNARNSGIANRNFSLLGDPSMKIPLAENELIIDAVQNLAGTDTLKGLSEVSISGEIRSAGTKNTSWAGSVEIEIYNSRSHQVTRGDENPPFEFDTWKQIIYRGSAPVSEGEFVLSFTTPANISEQFTQGKIFAFASRANTSDRAVGFYDPLPLSPENGILSDVIKPDAEIFVNDTTFTRGGIVNKDPVILIKVSDNFGIDITGNPSGRMLLTLDQDTTFFIGDFFKPDRDKSTSGRVSYPLYDLDEGMHQVSISVSDLSGNQTITETTFIVDTQNFRVSALNGWPNPFTQTTNIWFEHTRPGDDLSGTLSITDYMGRTIRSVDFRSDQAPGKTVIMEWDGTDFMGNRLSPGIYLLRLDLQSELNGAKITRFGKLILSN